VTLLLQFEPLAMLPSLGSKMSCAPTECILWQAGKMPSRQSKLRAMRRSEHSVLWHRVRSAVLLE
jgi:hypothetical protein